MTVTSFNVVEICGTVLSAALVPEILTRSPTAIFDAATDPLPNQM